MKTIIKKQAVLNCRTATKEYVNSELSLLDQKRVGREYVQKNGYDIRAIFYDHGECGRTIERPGLTKFSWYQQNNSVKGQILIVSDIAKISRNALIRTMP